jgi:ubiquinone/menaquinone biosynthesis C-methylase UbiE
LGSNVGVKGSTSGNAAHKRRIKMDIMKFFRKFGDLGINGAAARWYDRNSRGHRMEEMRGYAKEAAGYIKDRDSVLEIAPGPGYLSIELAKMGKYKITGIDISRDFVEIARKNAKEAGVEAEFLQGNVAAMPFPGNMFDFIICTAAFKNFKEPIKALEEMHRVLREGGTALIIDMNGNVSDKEIKASIKDMGEKGMEAVFMKLVFKYFLKSGAYTGDEFISMISKTGFKKFDIKKQGIGFNIYLQK